MADLITVNVFADIDDFLKWGEETISVLNRLNFLLRNIPKIKVSTASEGKEGNFECLADGFGTGSSPSSSSTS